LVEQRLPEAIEGAMSYYPPPGPLPGPIGPPGPWPPYGGPPQWPPYGPQWPQQYWPGPPRRSHKAAWIIVGVVAFTAVLLGLVLALAGGGGGSPAGRVPYGGSAETQIRQTVKHLDDAYNRSDASALIALTCDERKDSPSFHAPSDAELRRMLQLTGPESTAVTDIVVTGDRATSRVTTTFAKSVSKPSGAEVFVREAGVWKICGHTKTIAS
jgi:hypothetical protein